MGTIEPILSRRAFIGGAMALGASLRFAGSPAFAATAPWPGVTAMVQDYVRSGKVAGAVAAMGLGQDDAAVIARGSLTYGLEGAVDGDSLFRIYSMTKPITGIAVMMLVEEGKLALDQPLAEILPKFAQMQVQRVPDGSLRDLVPAARPITIRHLLTHTSGLGYSIIQKGPIKTAYVRAGLVPGAISRLPLPGFGRGESVQSLALFADRLATMPLVYQPGTRWSYSVGLDLLGRVIEVVSGQSFDSFLKQRLFDPLGMASTFFTVPRKEAHRLTTNYGVIGGVLLPLDPAALSVFLDRAAAPFGGSGLISSPRDYDRFLRMLQGFGRFEGNQVMKEETVRLATSNLLPPGIVTSGTFANGGGFGAGGRVGLGKEEGTFGWAGAAGTIGFVDIKRSWRGAFYAQYMPADAWPAQRKFPEIAMTDALGMIGPVTAAVPS